MSDETPFGQPLPFKDQYETPAVTQERSLGDVVEPRSSLGPRFHLDRLVEFDATAPPRPARHLPADYRRRGENPDASNDTAHHHDLAFEAPVASDHPDPHHEDISGAGDFDGDAHDRPHNPPTRHELLARDRFERQVQRERVRRERLERRRERSAHSDVRRSRRALARPRDLGRGHQRARHGDPGVRGNLDPGQRPVRDRRQHDLPSDPFARDSQPLTDVGTDAHLIGRPLGVRVHGTALVLYFTLLPYVVLSKWHRTSSESNGPLLRALLILLAFFWCGFLCQVARNVWRLRRGRRVKSGGSAWLAGLIVAVLALAVPAPATAHEPTAIALSYQSTSRSGGHRGPTPLTGLAPLPLALMAKRRNDLLRHGDGEDLFDVDESIELLRSLDPDLIGRLVALIGDASDGVLDVSDSPSLNASAVPSSPLVACSLGPSVTGSLVAFAKEGGRLAIRASWSAEDVQRRVVALHQGVLTFARSESELLRALATRTLRQSVVLYLGPANELDDELASCAITLTPYLEHETRHPRPQVAEAPRPSDLRVELLRADPSVEGLAEAFTPTLRRRCVEMVAYLALHRHEPVTGERLRTRVLVHADVEASNRTLANTASAVRRSLGADAHGPRLHPVTSSGLYVTHGLSSDVEVFSTLVQRARQLPVADAAPLAHDALLLIKGEPLASTLRGFEWFLAEGHAARLARDGEWAALALHHTSLQRGNYELAFWALQQGLLIDPYSDALSEALSRVPRLREFGGDGARLAQHQPVGARGTVAMSWSLTGLSQQVFQ
jgi:hypothetical protein